MVTRAGHRSKKTPLSDFSNVRNAGLIAISIDEGDELVSARVTNGKNDMFLCSKERHEHPIQRRGRASHGPHGPRRDRNGPRRRTIAWLRWKSSTRRRERHLRSPYRNENGYGKRTPVTDSAQSRGGKGVITMKTTDKNGSVMGARQVTCEG